MPPSPHVRMLRVLVWCTALLGAVLGGAPAAAAAVVRTPALPMDAIMRGVEAAKQEVRAALSDPEAAFESYLATFAAAAAARHPLPGGPGDAKGKRERFEIFKDNLARADAFNANSSHTLAALGITQFMHLTQEEFARHYLGQNFTGSSIQRADTTSMDGGEGGGSDSSSGSGEEDAGMVALMEDAPEGGMWPPSLLPYASRRLLARPRHMAAGPMPLQPSPEQQCSGLRTNPYISAEAPDAVDWVAAGRTTPIKDQGRCGSCVAFATTALAEWAHMHKYGTTNASTDLAEQDLLDSTPGNGCHGQHQELYIDMVACMGIAQEADVPYAAANDVDVYRRVPRYSGIAAASGGGWSYVMPDPDNMARALSQAPVMISMDARTWPLYKAGVLGCQRAGGQDVNHAVAVVGYFSGVQQLDGEVWDVYLVRNSWGTWWGSGNGPYAGHILVRKDCATTTLPSTPDDFGIAPVPG